MTRVLCDRLKTGGIVQFYAGSYAFDVAERVIAELVEGEASSPRRDPSRRCGCSRNSPPETEVEIMHLFRVYLRAISMLGAERERLRSRSARPTARSLIVALAEPLLFGQVVDALAKNATDRHDHRARGRP